MVTIRIDDGVYKIKDQDFLDLQKLEKELFTINDDNYSAKDLIQQKIKLVLREIKARNKPQNIIIYHYNIEDTY